MVKWSNPSIIPILGVGAEEGTRTPTGVTPLDPESQNSPFSPISTSYPIIQIFRRVHQIGGRSIGNLWYPSSSWVGTQKYEEDTPISCGRLFLTGYFLFCIFNATKASSYHLERIQLIFVFMMWR